ncbi:hypothetical protein AB5J49_17505 [Streptomyces sp. R28]|uniref:Uncharacterized protein n=1 Tax=Streptomyces sp. R28 TaxID=3238628 RepID=A0AB39PX30_9ACTN
MATPTLHGFISLRPIECLDLGAKLLSILGTEDLHDEVGKSIRGRLSIGRLATGLRLPVQQVNDGGVLTTIQRQLLLLGATVIPDGFEPAQLQPPVRDQKIRLGRNEEICPFPLAEVSRASTPRTAIWNAPLPPTLIGTKAPSEIRRSMAASLAASFSHCSSSLTWPKALARHRPKRPTLVTTA